MQNRDNIKNDIERARRGGQIAQELVDAIRDRDAEVNAHDLKLLTENSYSRQLLERLSVESNYDVKCDSKSDDVGRLVETLNKKSNRRRDSLRVRYWTVAVASVLLFVSFVMWYNNGEVAGVVAEDSGVDATSRNVVTPTLILSNGEDVDLMAGDMSILDDDSELENQSNNTLSYKKISSSSVIKYNTIIVPSKYTYNLILADGTSVTLNAGSRLKYPVNFGREERDVYLQGEAFFDVVKDSKPFIVHSEGVEIKVFGTKFNVNSNTKSMVKTFLVDGSVGVNINGGSYSMLKPNQLSIAHTVSSNNEIVDVSDGDKYISWLRNYFAFKHDNIDIVINELSRWYGVKIEVSGRTDASITALYSRSTELSEVLNSLEMIADVKFKIVANEVE